MNVMSYNLLFLHGQGINKDNIQRVMAGSEPRNGAIDVKLLNKLESDLSANGYRYETISSKDRNMIELLFPSYNMSILKSRIAVSVPYLENDSSESIREDLLNIIRTLKNNGFTGYDPQTGDLVNEQYDIVTSYNKMKHKMKIRLHKQMSNLYFFYLFLLGGITVSLALLYWKLFF